MTGYLMYSQTPPLLLRKWLLLGGACWLTLDSVEAFQLPPEVPRSFREPCFGKWGHPLSNTSTAYPVSHTDISWGEQLTLVMDGVMELGGAMHSGIGCPWLWCLLVGTALWGPQSGGWQRPWSPLFKALYLCCCQGSLQIILEHVFILISRW